MKKIILFSPELSSMNLGDAIIATSAKENLDFMLDDAFAVEVSTHLPISWFYMRHLKNFEYRFVLGSNLLKSTFFGLKRQWDITLRKSGLVKPCILVGAGWWQYGNKPNLYTKYLLKKVLSKEHIHSVRDEYTEKMLRSIGINNVINTSCPTMWKLTKEHCAQIPVSKSENAIFTITDYNKDYERDRILIECLLKNYNKVYFWPQGTGDAEYINQLNVDMERIIFVNTNLKSYDEILEKDVDYIGTRLHGGIRALQKKKRTLIISIDNRAKEKSKNFNIPILDRQDIKKLDEIINSNINTNINIPEENIRKWKEQFNGGKDE